MKHLLSLIAVLALAGCISINSDVVVADGEQVDGISSVNGSVRVGVASIVDGDISTVNGSVSTAERSQAGEIATVNGKLEIGPESVTKELETINGAIQIGGGALIDGDVGTVNGRITVGEGARVSGEVRAVNGQLLIQGAEVGSLLNVNGGMVLESGTVVNGALRVRKPRGSDDDPVTVEIHDNVRVAGPLVFEREVTLRVHEGAELGRIEGAEPEYFND